MDGEVRHLIEKIFRDLEKESHHSIGALEIKFHNAINDIELVIQDIRTKTQMLFGIVLGTQVLTIIGYFIMHSQGK